MAVFALVLAWTASAQTARRPGAEGQKERAEQQRRERDARQHAEDKSDGAAFSGRGRGGDKNLRYRDKDRHKGKGKKGRKGHKKHDGHHRDGRRADDGTAPTPQTRPGANGGNEPAPAPQRRPGERPTSGAEPKSTPRRQ